VRKHKDLTRFGKCYILGAEGRERDQQLHDT